MLTSPALNAALGQMEQGRVTTDDGVELLYQLFGAGPAVVLANGIGVRYPGVVRQIQALRPQHRVICWDYRGVGQSVMPPDGEVSMPRHARDILAILDALEIERALFVGWSMGVQVSLEVARLRPARLAGFVALLGTCGRPFDNAFPRPISDAITALFGFMGRHPQVAQALLDFGVSLPELTFEVLSRALFVGRDADREIFAANVRSVAGVDKAIYARTMLALAAHDAWDLLPQVACPALIIAAERDHLTPPRVARQIAASMPRATYRELDGATHFALIEKPEQINAWLLEFANQVFA
jgi:pimeloyl-ACP methyl ester carboxylesterase